MELRGFDSYDITLGDEMRGERASLGKSLEVAEGELRIKARVITAIEDCDLGGFTNQSVISGYVRSYARYLGMDPEDCYQRFCAESGYRSPAALMSTSGDGSGFRSLQRTPVTADVGAQLGKSRFAAPPSRNRFRARVSLGALTSAAALLALIGGLSYGGYALLQDIQRVGFAPLPEAPAVVAEAPVIGQPAIDTRELARPSAHDYEGGGALAMMRAPEELPPLNGRRRDGPISAIDPAQAGVFARVEEPHRQPARVAEPGGIDESPVLVGAAPSDTAAEPAVPSAPVEKGVVLHAAGPAWIKISGRDNTTIWQGTLKSGERYRLPDTVIEPVMRSGNAGSTFIVVDGVAYGPLGATGQIAKNISLVADDIRRSLPQAEASAFNPPEGAGAVQRADARVARP